MQNLLCNILAFQLQKNRSLSFSPEHMKYHAKWKQSSFWTTGIWPTNRMKVDHNLFNPSKAYQSLEVKDNSENDILNFNVESENDVNNQLLQSTNLTAMDCPSISTDNQVKNEKKLAKFLVQNLSQQGQLSVICSPSTQHLFSPKQVIPESGA